MDNGFSIKEILKKVIEELDNKINRIRKPKAEEKVRYSKSDFFISEEASKDFPISRDTYYGYSSFANKEKSAKDIQSIDLRRFYDICTYTDVSADYFLGFRETKRKEVSAEMIRKEYGLSDDAMALLARVNSRKPECRGELSSDLMDFILKNENFWNKLDGRLPVYLACLYEARTSEIDMDVARYSIIRAFEELLDEICNAPMIQELPHTELDENGAFYS